MAGTGGWGRGRGMGRVGSGQGGWGVCVRGCVGARFVGKAATVLRQGETRYLLTMASGDQGTTQATRWVPLFLARSLFRSSPFSLSFSRKMLPRGCEPTLRNPQRGRRCDLLLLTAGDLRNLEGNSVTASGLACVLRLRFPLFVV